MKTTHHTPYGAVRRSIVLACIFLIFTTQRLRAQAIGVTSQNVTSTICAGTAINITYSITGTFSNTPATNSFVAQLSDAFGSFSVSPVSIGTKTGTAAGTIASTIPSTLTTSSNLYRVRVISTNPAVNGSDNGVNLTINIISLNTAVVTATSLCQGETFSFNFTQGSCNFLNTPSANIYSVQLSDASGSFASPVTVGTRTATTAAAITCTIPVGTPAGIGYRVRIQGANPSIASPDNGSDIIINASAGTPTVYGNGTWNAYCYNAFNNFNLNYQGYFTENNLNINTTLRYSNSISPSSANAASGAAYSGCPFGIGTNYSVAFRRTNIPCDYYQIDIPSHDDYVYILINGVTQYSAGCCTAVTNVWSGIIQPTDLVDVLYSNNGGAGNLSVNLTNPNPLVTYPVTICASTTASMQVINTSAVSITYSWAPAAFVSPTTGSAVAGTPTANTVYTVTGTDVGSGCSIFSQTLAVTINTTAATTTSVIASTICAGYASSTITATGANTYSWSPATGLNTTSGNVVIASPAVTTTYSVKGSNNCNTVTATRVISVQIVPTTPTPTVFGNGFWNVYCYNTTGFTNYYGFYTDNVLSFTTTTRWGASVAPSSANSTNGTAYQGCTMGVDNHSASYRRTNFTCGYYQIDIPAHYDDVTLYINGTQVFQHIGSADSHTNVWSGFLGASSTVEFTCLSTTGNSLLQVTFTSLPYPSLSAPVTICAGTNATLTAGPFLSGDTYSWSPASSLSTSSGTVTVATPTVSTNYTCVLSDPGTGCSISQTTSITTNPLPSTSVSPLTSTLNCSAQSTTLTASGANTYSWAPATALNTTTGNVVIANPSVTTVYTVTGSNNCTNINATATINLLAIGDPTFFPTGTWNAYCYGSTTFTNYYGYYTENGSGASGYDFTTTTRWASSASPSTTNSVNGNAFIGCTVPTTNWSISFKRTNFVCNTYSINIVNHDKAITILVNGVQVAAHTGAADAHPAIWVGPLGPNSTVELKLNQTTGTSGLNITFSAAATPSICKWVGATSTDWFTASNWCGSIPVSSQDVLIYNTGTLFQPAITANGAACQNLTIQGASASTTVTSAIAAASLAVSGAFGLDVHGNWTNGGSFTSGTGTVNILGSGSKTITATAQSFYKLVLNNSGDITIPAGTHSISNNMDFTNGIVTQNGNLIFLNNATATNANNNCYVVGKVIKYGTQAFDFPVGANNLYRPISISSPSLTTDNFTAQYFNSDPSPTYIYSSKDATIDHIGRCEYWILNRTGGTSNVNVKMTWNTTSCVVDNLTDLTIARWDAGQVKWKDQGNGGTTGNTTSGSVITNSLVTLFSPFTLASKTTSNPLPIELVQFDVVCIDKQADLTWSTASETNNDYFTVQRSKDGVNYESIGTVDGAGTSKTLRNYAFTDVSPLAGVYYYRLRQTDFNGDNKYYKLIPAQCSKESFDINIYPNPTEGKFNIEGYGSSAQVTVLNTTGQVILQNAISDNLAQLDLSHENRGIYFILIQTPYNSVTRKLIVR